MIAYPSSFPCASRIEGHSAALAAGVIRTPMNAGVSRQRRAYRHLPQQISLVFIINQSTYANWLSWVNAHAWDEWITMNLPGLRASAAGTATAPTAVRFFSDLQAELIPVSRLWIWRVRVQAEYVPLASDYLALDGVWIVPGRPAVPEPDWVLGGSPGAPAPIFTNPGTPAQPTVLI